MLHHLARTLLKDLNCAGAVIGPDGDILDVNPAFSASFYTQTPDGKRVPCLEVLNALRTIDKPAAASALPDAGILRRGDKAYRVDVYILDKRSGNEGLRLMIATPMAVPPAAEERSAALPDEPVERLSAEFAALIGRVASFIQALLLAQRAARTDLPVLIMGESGTGKEILARTIHQAGRRRNKAFVDVNCAAIPDSLVESELFGYEKGAFTGADPSGKAGFFENAHQGSIFMDEIGDAAPQTQAKLLRVLESGQFKRIGGRRNIAVDVRLISATNQELSRRIVEGRFRADLLYRINTITIKLLPLRERLDDLPLLANHFLQSAGRDRKGKLRLSKEVMERLRAYSWPGNVRELKGVVDYAVTMTTGAVISPKALPSFLRGPSAAATPPVPAAGAASDIETDRLLPVVENAEKEQIQKVLATSQTRSEAIRRLGISRRTFYAKLKRYRLA